jgi:hypothetical protein
LKSFDRAGVAIASDGYSGNLRPNRGLAVNVTDAVPYIDAVRCLPEPTFLVTSEGIMSDANLAGLSIVGPAIFDHSLRLSSFVENSEAEVTSFLQRATESRSSIGGKIV